MTQASTNWPDQKRPGVPLFPERDGWHLLRVFGGTTIEWWSANAQAFNNHYDPRYTIYDCACLTPTQINEMLAAERERICLMIERSLDASCSLLPTAGKTLLKAATEDITDAIRNLGDAP